MEPLEGRRFCAEIDPVGSVDWGWVSQCVGFPNEPNKHILYSSLSAGSKSKALTPQWDIMAKRVSEAGRPSASQQDEVHELDWTLCRNDL